VSPCFVQHMKLLLSELILLLSLPALILRVLWQAFIGIHS
jgi:hypothetical protein